MSPLPTRLAFACLLAALLAASDSAALSIIRAPGPVATGHNDYTWTVDPNSLDIAIDRDGTVVLAWREFESGNASNAFMALAAYDPATFGLLAMPTRLDMGKFYSFPHVAARAEGGFLGTWPDTRITDGSTLLDQALDRLGAPTKAPGTVLERGHPPTYISAHAIVGLPSGIFAVAWRDNGIRARLVDGAGVPYGDVIPVGDLGPEPLDVAVATASDGGFIVAWQPSGLAPKALHFGAGGQVLGDVFSIGDAPRLHALAASPAGDVLAAVLVHTTPAPDAANQLWLQRFTSAGVMLGPEVLVQDSGANLVNGDLDFDPNGNLYVVWTVGYAHVLARGYDTGGNALEPPTTIDPSRGGVVRTARNGDGNFVNVTGPNATVSVVSLCTAGTSVCGDSVLDPVCERCDDGPGNSDVTPDACRTTCRPPRCGDGVVDTGEGCDDGNRDDCDGCTHACQPEIGLGCGDGVALPACGETCDDGNPTVGDGCAPGCALERVPGGGVPKTDCYVEWSVDNPVNLPLFDKNGHINGIQTCTDGDLACDHDGGTPGSCTFALKVCVNNTEAPAACEPSTRLASWELTGPSEAKAQHDPAAAAVRAAFASVPGTIVGPSTHDLCTQTVLVPVPVKPNGKPGRMKLKSRGQIYGKAQDKDILRLVCVP